MPAQNSPPGGSSHRRTTVLKRSILNTRQEALLERLYQASVPSHTTTTTDSSETDGTPLCELAETAAEEPLTNAAQQQQQQQEQLLVAIRQEVDELERVWCTLYPHPSSVPGASLQQDEACQGGATAADEECHADPGRGALYRQLREGRRRLRKLLHTANVGSGSSPEPAATVPPTALPPRGPAAGGPSRFLPDMSSLPSASAASATSIRDLRCHTRHPVCLQSTDVEHVYQSWRQLLEEHGDEDNSRSGGGAAEWWAAALQSVTGPLLADLGTKQSAPHRPSRPNYAGLSRFLRHSLTTAFDDLAFTTLHYLYEEQHSLRQKAPLQQKARQRYSIGLNETLKLLRAGRVQVVLLAADLELEAQPGNSSAVQPSSAAALPGKRKGPSRSLSEAVESIQAVVAQHNPAAVATTSHVDPQQQHTTSSPSSDARAPLWFFCLSRHAMSYALMCKGRDRRVGCVGILQAEYHHFLVKALRAYGSALMQEERERREEQQEVSVMDDE